MVVQRYDNDIRWNRGYISSRTKFEGNQRGNLTKHLVVPMDSWKERQLRLVSLTLFLLKIVAKFTTDSFLANTKLLKSYSRYGFRFGKVLCSRRWHNAASVKLVLKLCSILKVTPWYVKNFRYFCNLNVGVWITEVSVDRCSGKEVL